MGKRTYIKFLGSCQIKKVNIKGKNPILTMKCPKSVTKKIKKAQDLINES